MENKDTALLQEVASQTANPIEYRGQITVSIMDGDRLISKNKYTNSGTSKLFAFLTNCLSGDFNTARYNRPCRLLLLEGGSGEDLDTSNPADEDADSNGNAFWGEHYYVAPPVYYSKTPTALGNAVTFNFRVPFLLLNNGAIVKKMALVPELSSDISDICAFYILSDSIQVPTSGGNFTILVDWELSFSNKA